MWRDGGKTIILAAFAGAMIAALRPPGRVFRSSIQHFAAGVIFSVVAVELLPDVRRGHDPLEVGLAEALEEIDKAGRGERVLGAREGGPTLGVHSPVVRRTAAK